MRRREGAKETIEGAMRGHGGRGIGFGATKSTKNTGHPHAPPNGGVLDPMRLPGAGALIAARKPAYTLRMNRWVKYALVTALALVYALGMPAHIALDHAHTHDHETGAHPHGPEDHHHESQNGHECGDHDHPGHGAPEHAHLHNLADPGVDHAVGESHCHRHPLPHHHPGDGDHGHDLLNHRTGSKRILAPAPDILPTILPVLDALWPPTPAPVTESFLLPRDHLVASLQRRRGPPRA
ncbi:MAG: hypothetical protein KF886_07805 [Candidatus Hydrogenedentes bacterium]|nr:hypothetical protein [Candidatus Hydrogenedentota bacterium]